MEETTRDLSEYRDKKRLMMAKGKPTTGNGRTSGGKIKVRDIIWVVFTRAAKGTGAISGKNPNIHYLGKGDGK